MAAKKRRTVEKVEYYIEGNTVRKVDPQRQMREAQQRRAQADARARRNREREAVMNPGYVLFLVVAVVITAGIFMMYLMRQSELVGHMHNVAALESELVELQSDNDAAESRIDKSLQLNEIKNKAINELGMTYPSADQIRYYTVDEQDYMEQYEDVPEK